MLRSLFNKIFISLLFFSVISACSPEPPFSNKPQIELLAYGPDTVKELIDSIYFSISYQDGDGDLGENNVDNPNLYVTDTRISIDYKFRIQQLVPGQAKVPIRGVLNFSIPNTFITNGESTQEVSYQIYIIDRAQNKSNVLTTGEILIIQ